MHRGNLLSPITVPHPCNEEAAFVKEKQSSSLYWVQTEISRGSQKKTLCDVDNTTFNITLYKSDNEFWGLVLITHFTVVWKFNIKVYSNKNT